MIDVEQAFDVVVRRLGGARVTDLIPDTGKLPPNADYVFKHWNVLAELKRLDRDLFSSLGLKQRLGRSLALWEKRGLIKLTGDRINLQDLPEPCARELSSILRAKIEGRIVKPASDQIKSTRTLLQMPEAFGLLIVAHEGNKDLTPEATMHLIACALPGSDIHSGVD